MLYKEAEPIEKELAEIVVENGMVYHLAENGCYYPDINAKQNTDYPVGKYGMMRGNILWRMTGIDISGWCWMG